MPQLLPVSCYLTWKKALIIFTLRHVFYKNFSKNISYFYEKERKAKGDLQALFLGLSVDSGVFPSAHLLGKSQKCKKHSMTSFQRSLGLLSQGLSQKVQPPLAYVFNTSNPIPHHRSGTQQYLVLRSEQHSPQLPRELSEQPKMLSFR